MKNIVVSNLNKQYGDKIVLRNFSATFEAGSVTNIMGSSGCGKTTLLNILMGLERADGTIAEVPKHISAVFQEDRLCDEFLAVSNVRVVTGKKVPTFEIQQHLCMLGLGDSLEKPVRELSGGMKRRVAIVRAVLYNGDVLFLDEAFKGLDEKTKDTAINYILKYMSGRTIINVTHDANDAAKMGGKVIEMLP